jgi:hypothetical protein
VHSIAVMIKAIVTRVLALALRQWPGRLHCPGSFSSLAAARWASAMSSLALPGARSDVDQLAGVNDRLLLSVAPGRRDRRALEIVDLARVKIDQSQPRTAASRRLSWSQRTDIPRIMLLPGASAGLGRVPNVAAFRWPRLVAVLAVVLKPRFHAFGEGGL